VEVVELAELVERARVVALPMRERFRGIDVREALLVEAPNGWVEWSPFVEYDDAEASTWLSATIEDGWGAGPALRRDSVRVNATVPAVAPAAVPEVLARFPGCRTAKVKVAGGPLAEDLARVAAVREALGPDGRIRVDANGAWSLDEALAALHALLPYRLEYAEQPCATTAELAELRTRLGGAVRIAADESVRKAEDPFEVARLGAADVIVVKPQPIGGASRALEIALAAGLPVVASSALETSVGLAAAVRFAAALPDFDLDHGLGTAALLAADVTLDPLLPVDGTIAVRQVTADAGLLEAFAAPSDRRDWWLARLARCAALIGG
jgi:O-succinylbenzoate synthase